MVLFKQLPWCCSSERGSSVKYRYAAYNSKSPPSHSATVPAGCHSQKLCKLLIPTLEPWAGVLMWGRDLSLLREDLPWRDIPPDFQPPHMRVWTPLSTSPPLLPVLVWLLLPARFRWSAWWLFCNFVVILMCFGKVLSYLFTYATILTDFCWFLMKSMSKSSQWRMHRDH